MVGDAVGFWVLHTPQDFWHRSLTVLLAKKAPLTLSSQISGLTAIMLGHPIGSESSPKTVHLVGDAEGLSIGIYVGDSVLGPSVGDCVLGLEQWRGRGAA